MEAAASVRVATGPAPAGAARPAPRRARTAAARPAAAAANLRDDLAGDPVGHLVAHPRIQLRCAGEELAGQLGLLGTQAGQLQRRRPPRQLTAASAAAGAASAPRSLITTVPANTSPMRLPFDDSRLQITAGPPKNVQISMTPASARNSACRKRSGPPSSDTTRSPSAILPSDRPRVAVSKIDRIADDREHGEDDQHRAGQARCRTRRASIAHNMTPRM